jgi:hypothetical protein
MEILVCSNWLNMLELGNLDIAMSNHGARELWLNMLKVDGSQAVNKWRQSHFSLRWIIMRFIRISQILVNPKHCLQLYDITFEVSGTTSKTQTRLGDQFMG